MLAWCSTSQSICSLVILASFSAPSITCTHTARLVQRWEGAGTRRCGNAIGCRQPQHSREAGIAAAEGAQRQQKLRGGGGSRRQPEAASGTLSGTHRGHGLDGKLEHLLPIHVQVGKGGLGGGGLVVQRLGARPGEQAVELLLAVAVCTGEEKNTGN